MEGVRRRGPDLFAKKNYFIVKWAKMEAVDGKGQPWHLKPSPGLKRQLNMC